MAIFGVLQPRSLIKAICGSSKPTKSPHFWCLSAMKKQELKLLCCICERNVLKTHTRNFLGLGLRVRVCVLVSFNNEQKLFFSIGCNKCLLAKLFVHQNQIENVENEKAVRVSAIRTKVLSIVAIMRTIHRLCDQQMSTFAYSC